MTKLEYLKFKLDYKRSTGVFTHKTGRLAGKSAGFVCENGYFYVSYGGETHLGSKLAWFYCHGHYPHHMVMKHKNDILIDIRLVNLEFKGVRLSQQQSQRKE